MDELVEVPQEKKVKVYPCAMVDITNPTKRVKIIYTLSNPLNPAEAIGIEPGQTITGIKLATHVLDYLRTRDRELEIVKAGTVGDMISA
jgi:hypothetical protein